MSDIDDMVVIESHSHPLPDKTEDDRRAHGTTTSPPTMNARMDHQTQLLRLEQRNKKRLLIAREQQEGDLTSLPTMDTAMDAGMDYQTQLMLLEQQNKKRLPIAREEQGDDLTSPPTMDAGMDHQAQLMLLEQQNRKRLLMAREEQDGLTSPPTMDPGMNYQAKLVLLEQQNKKRLLMAREEQDDLTRMSSAPLLPPVTAKDTARKAQGPAVSTSIPQGLPIFDEASEIGRTEENTTCAQHGDPPVPAPPADTEVGWPSFPGPQYHVCSTLPPTGFPGPVPPPPPPGAPYRLLQRAPWCHPPPPMSFLPLDSWVSPPCASKPKKPAKSSVGQLPPPPPVPVEILPRFPPVKPVRFPCHLHHKDGVKCRASFGDCAARRNHETVHYDVRTSRRGRVRDRHDDEVDSVAPWDESDSVASDCEFDASNRVVRFLSYRALLRCGEEFKDATVILEPFGCSVYVTAHPATVVDFKKFLPFLKHANLECWYTYPTNAWFNRARVLEAGGGESIPLVPVGRPNPAAVDWLTIAVTAALTSGLEGEIGECDVYPDTSECDMRAHRTLPPHRNIMAAKNQLAYYSIVSTVEDIPDCHTPYATPPTAPLLPALTPLFKVVRTGSREAAAAQAFMDAGVNGWSTLFTCVVKEDAQLAKIKDHEFVRAGQCSEIVTSGAWKLGQTEKVFY